MNNPSRKTRLKKSSRYILYLLAVTIISLEIMLRIHYPFATRIRGDRLELSANTHYALHNRIDPRLDSIVIHNKNSIGFRGEDPPKDSSERLSILAIGGSTTECTWLSEGKTWPDRLGKKLQSFFPRVWINNAGFDGHSTYGNINLLHYYIPTLSFRPRIALFLVGANDVSRNDLDSYNPDLNSGAIFKIKKWALRHSETINFIVDLKNALHPPELFPGRGIPGQSIWRDSLRYEKQIDSVTKIQYALLPAFQKRLANIVSECKNMNIRPVFITQPLAIAGHSPMGNWKLFWYELQPYNEATRAVAREQNVFCIDLATLMPADTAFYYDMLHYTNAGAEKVAELLSGELIPWIDGNFTGYRKKEP